jgi:hypothetical protein
MARLLGKEPPAPQLPADTSVDVASAPNASTRTHFGGADRNGHWYPSFIRCTVHSVQPLGGPEQVKWSAAFATAL